MESKKSKFFVKDVRDNIGIFPFFTSGESILKFNTFLIDGRYCFLNTGGNADVKFHIGKAAYSTDTWCISAINNMTDYLFLFLHIHKEEINQKYFQGTGLKHLQKDMLKQKEVYIPTEEELNNFNKVIQPIFNSISLNKQENEVLRSCIDTLLPLLMNNQVTID
ncbi:restriction endonuclease subunit S [Mycoplasma mycoides]|uniref:restriction endonuclease subunit S n=1 Tax=Mycoplasma mycoides TaxID=2102 RepID=UPI00223F6BFE|nr:restriction endonuclease subunit S [Mycoplasma mycoides]